MQKKAWEKKTAMIETTDDRNMHGARNRIYMNRCKQTDADRDTKQMQTCIIFGFHSYHVDKENQQRALQNKDESTDT